MNIKWLIPLLLLCPALLYATPHERKKKTLGLSEVRALIHQNRTVIAENFNRQIAAENLRQQKAQRLPALQAGSDGYLEEQIPLGSTSADSRHSFLYHFTLSSEFDLYSGGLHRHAIERMRKEEQLSEERLQAVEQDVQLRAYILLYDILRNIKYQDFIRSSIRLREKEYERINQLYLNGLVLKSDLLRSKLYITDLQKDDMEIQNSIDILSEKLCVLLGLEERYLIRPQLEDALDNHLSEDFDALFSHARRHSPLLKMSRTQAEQQEIALQELRSGRLPRLQLYADYTLGKAAPAYDFDHQLGGQVGARVSLNLSSLYKTRHKIHAQQQRISREKLACVDQEENLREEAYELYTRYLESLMNIKRALEKIEMSKETMRILSNSYFNQQALLVDVLNSETQAMKASFEWVEAVVDSQKYYWALKQICGYL